LLMGVSGFLIKYSQEVRMYSLVFLLSATSLWLFLKVMNQAATKFFWPLATINLLLVYTHYYGWILVAVEALVISIWRRKALSRFAILLGGLLFAYLPWIYEVWKLRGAGNGLAQNIGWIARPGLRDVGRYFISLIEP